MKIMFSPGWGDEGRYNTHTHSSGALTNSQNVSHWKQGEDGDRYILKTSLELLPKAKPESKNNFMFSFLPFDLIINS